MRRPPMRRTGACAPWRRRLASANPFAGHLFAFRGRRGDLVKILYWDGQGFYLFDRYAEDCLHTGGSSMDAPAERFACRVLVEDHYVAVMRREGGDQCRADGDRGL